LRPQFDLNELLESEIWQTGLFSDMYLYWQTSLMQAEGGMDHIPKAFRDRLDPKTQILLNAIATGISQSADKIFIKHSKSEVPIITELPPEYLDCCPMKNEWLPHWRVARNSIRICSNEMLKKAYRLPGKIYPTRQAVGHTIKIRLKIPRIYPSVNLKGGWYWPVTTLASSPAGWKVPSGQLSSP